MNSTSATVKRPTEPSAGASTLWRSICSLKKAKDASTPTRSTSSSTLPGSSSGRNVNSKTRFMIVKNADVFSAVRPFSSQKRML